MKRLILLITLTFSLQIASSQVWFDVGVKGGYGMSLLMNKNIFNDASYNHQFTTGNGFGGRIGLNFGENHGFTFDVMSHKLKQNFEYSIVLDNNSYTNAVTWKTLDLYLLYRYSSQRTFIELGGMLSRVRDVDQADSNPLFLVDDVNDYYVDQYYSAVFGFGGFLIGNESFSLNLNIRAHYALQDFISDLGKNPTALSANNFNFPNPIREDSYTSNTSTRPLFIEVGLELNVGIGGFAKTSCSQRRHWFWSGN